MPAPAEFSKVNVSLLILSCLARTPMHGYRIVKELQNISEGYFNMREGTLYPHLHQLEQDGLVESSWETVSGGRERKIYRITSRGTSELARMQQEWRRLESSINRVVDQSPEVA